MIRTSNHVSYPSMSKMLGTLLEEILVVVCHDLFKSYRGESPTFLGLKKPEKGKSIITFGLNVCLF